MKLDKSPVLVLGTILRLALILLFTQNFVSDFFFPFLSSVRLTWDPWSEWIATGINPTAFPYGLILLFLLLPITILSKAIDSTPSPILISFLFSFIFIIVEVYIFRSIKRFSGSRAADIYFLSPIIIFVTYGYKQTDIFVCLFMFLTGIFLVKRQSTRAGIALGLAIGCKFGVSLVIPFFLIFAMANRRSRKEILKSTYVAILVSFANYLPVLWSSGFRRMVFNTPEKYRITDLYIETGGFKILFFPALYMFLALWIYRTGRANVQVLIGFVGVSLFILGITSAQTIGWTLWGLALLLITTAIDRVEYVATLFILQVLLILRDFALGNRWTLDLNILASSEIIKNSLVTVSITLGFVWSLSSLTKIIETSDLMKLSSKPLSIAISGDSGVGKDTVSEGIEDFFGSENVLTISGDSYHKYERGDDRWIATTHLNPKENSLFRWRKDLTKALRRKEFYSRDYNHLFGRFSSSYKAKVADVVVSQGLHALYDSLDDGVDLKVYMEMENQLRINFKVNRDSSTRGQDKKMILNQIRKRQKDFRTYVEPQKNKADAYIYLSSSTRYADKVDMVELTFKQPHSAEFLFSALQPFLDKCQLLNDKRGFVKIRICELEDISSFVLTKFLQTHAPEMVAMSRKISTVESGSRGLIVAVLIVLWEYLRLEAYDENYS